MNTNERTEDITFCTGCLTEGLDPWGDTDEGYTHCCNKRLGYTRTELDEIIAKRKNERI